MARLHANKDVVISIDLKDYFGKIHVKHMVPLLASYGVQDTAGRLAAELCSYKFFLPQGGLTSPKMSNLVAGHTFGPVLKKYADSMGLTMTIYADDVTFSFNGEKNVSQILGDTARILRENGGFFMKEEKTKVMTSRYRQVVCGVVVNEKPNLAKQERNRLRAIVRNIELHGIRAEADKNELDEDEFVSSIRGRLNWYKQLNPTRAMALVDKFTRIIKENPGGRATVLPAIVIATPTSPPQPSAQAISA